MERSTHAIKNGKPSISIRAIYTMAMLVTTRGYPSVFSGRPPTAPIQLNPATMRTFSGPGMEALGGRISYLESWGFMGNIILQWYISWASFMARMGLLGIWLILCISMYYILVWSLIVIVVVILLEWDCLGVQPCFHKKSIPGKLDIN